MQVTSNRKETKSQASKNQMQTSLQSSNIVSAQTKAEAIQKENEGFSIGINKQIYSMIIEYHRQFGMTNQLPNEQNDRISYVKSFYRSLAIRNPYFPNELNIEFVLKIFFEDVIVGKVDNIYPNIRSHISAFKLWFWNNKARIHKMHDKFFPIYRPQLHQENYGLPDDCLNISKEDAIQTLASLKRLGKEERLLVDSITPNEFYTRLKNTFRHYKISY